MRQWGVCIHWGGKQCVIMFFLFQGPDSRPDVSWDDGHVSVSNHYCSSPSRLKPIQSYYSGEQGSLVGAIKALVNSPLSRCLCRCQHMSKSTHTFTCFQGPKWVWILLFVWYQDKLSHSLLNGISLLLVNCLIVRWTQRATILPAVRSQVIKVLLLLKPQSSLICKTE